MANMTEHVAGIGRTFARCAGCFSVKARTPLDRDQQASDGFLELGGSTIPAQVPVVALSPDRRRLAVWFRDFPQYRYARSC